MRTPSATRAPSADVFERLTDLLAELVLEDMRQFPTVAALKGVDSGTPVENIVAVDN